MTDPVKPAVEAGVLVPVYRDAAGNVRLVLIRRSDGGTHGGHLAFPGGKREPRDRSMRDAALREAQEEIGLPPSRVDVLADLPPVDTRTTGFRVYPILGRVLAPTTWQPDAREVAEVIEARLDDLLRPDAHGEAEMRMPEWPAPERRPFYRVGAYMLWGVTYRIVQPLIPRLAAGEWPL